MFSTFKKIKKFLSGKGIYRIPLATSVYHVLYQYLKPKGFWQTEVQGRKMYVDSEDKYIAPLLMMNGIYAPFETEIFRREMKKGMTVVDIGAHWGYYTTLAAELSGGTGKVFAFEPNPNNYSLLIKNIETNGYTNVTATQKAVSDKVGIAELFLAQGNSGDHRIYNPGNDRESIQIETVSLDEFFKDKNEQIDLIKIDTQGAEMAILQGMDNIIKENTDLTIITEFWPMSLKKFGYSPEEYLNRLIEYGFKLFHIDEQTQKVESVDVDGCMRICPNEKHLNLLCKLKL